MKGLNLDIGTVTVGLDFENSDLVSCFKDYFLTDNSINQPDIHIKIRFTSRRRIDVVPNSLFLTKKIKKNGFVAGDGLINGKFSKREGIWHFSIHNLLIEGNYKRVFEQILYQAYNSAAVKKQAYLIHSCGVIKDGEGYLFAGPAGSGKSTVAALSQAYQVLNDEINIVDISSETAILEGTPYNGLYRDKKYGRAPLKGVFLLNQAHYHQLEPISGGKAIKPLTKEIIPPITLEEELSPGTYIKMMDMAGEIAGRVPIYRMDFLPDKDFWNGLSLL